jgi:hypothetical protein
MSSKITLKNNLGTEFTIEHKDGSKAKTISSNDITMAVDTVANMVALLNPQEGQVVIVRDANQGGTFIYDSNKVGENNGGTIFNGWTRRYDGAVNVKWFGAKGDGVTDDTVSLKAAHYVYENIEYPVGNYKISDSIQVKKGAKICGGNGLRFTDLSMQTIITQTIETAYVFVQDESISTGQEDGFSCYDMQIKSNFGFKLNDPTSYIEDGLDGTNPYLMRSKFIRLTFTPLTNGYSGSTGLIMSKCFDFKIEQCEFVGFARHLVMQGCDIGMVTTNRFSIIYDVGILELSCSTFGSQNIITNNDMVFCAGSSGRFIRTTSRHVRIKDNYLEQASGQCVGFIDMSPIGVPSYGSNYVSETAYSSIIVDDNRIDGMSFATGFIYRIPDQRLLNTHIRDMNTTGIPSSMGWIKDSSGNSPSLRLIWNTDNISRYYLSGGRGTGVENSDFKDFITSDFVSNCTDRLMITSKNIVHLDRSELNRNLSVDNVRLRPDGFVILTSNLNNLFHCILPNIGSVSNPWLLSAATYTVTVTARTLADSQNLTILKIVDAGGVGATVSKTFTNQFDTMTTTFTGVASSSKVGLALSLGATQSNSILIQSITFQKV